MKLKNLFNFGKKEEKFETYHYLIAMLKAYGIKNIIASPGMQNAAFNACVQEDDFFNCYSVVDERSAAYFATGVSYEVNKPVVVTCTEATSSRNYASALTEAYYKKIPIVAITFYNDNNGNYNLTPQYIDRSVTQNDIKEVFVNLPEIKNLQDKSICITRINNALSTAIYKNMPVIINCQSGSIKNAPANLPADFWIGGYSYNDFEEVISDITNKRTAVFIGSHKKFDNRTHEAISNFATTMNIPVICDHTSNYHGANKILISQAVKMLGKKEKPELVIDIGNVCGDYQAYSYFLRAKVYRISHAADFNTRYGVPIHRIFTCPEYEFFESVRVEKTDNYYDFINSKIQNIEIKQLPLCMGYVCTMLSKYIPANSSLNLSILNSLRNMDYVSLNESIDVNCNVGGFGIDGALSTLVGMSVTNKDKKFFGIIGDLAFFYDMNILGNRHISNNLRIILVNNNRGEEFRLNQSLEKEIGNKTDVLIAAAKHYKNGARGWAESCNFKYLKAQSLEEFNSQIEKFCNGNYSQPVLFEVFTNDENEKAGIEIIRKAYRRY